MRQPSSVFYIYSGVALAPLLGIATVALVLVPPAPKAEPYFQGRVGFASDRTMCDDVALIWWNDTPPRDEYRESVESTDSRIGTYRYVGRGARWSLGGWPQREHPFFDRTESCR